MIFAHISKPKTKMWKFYDSFSYFCKVLVLTDGALNLTVANTPNPIIFFSEQSEDGEPQTLIKCLFHIEFQWAAYLWFSRDEWYIPQRLRNISALMSTQNGCHFADDSFKCSLLNENVYILIKISSKFVPMGSMKYIKTSDPIMNCRWPGDRPQSEPMLVRLLTHICFTRPRWVEMFPHCLHLMVYLRLNV